MKLRNNKVSAILAASVLAVLGLVVFQMSWMRYSSDLSEELFNQRASMALCNAVERYAGGALCGNPNSAGCCASANELPCDSVFQANLRQSLDFYQINLDYQLSLSKERQSCADNKTVQCAVEVPTDSGAAGAFLNVAFPEKETFVLRKMNFMVLATILILLFVASVLLMANWSLMKQKRLLRTNVDFFNNMAHEFRTPLTNIGLAANMLAKKNEALKDNPMLDIIRRENAKLLQQVERVLYLASFENGDYALQKEQLLLRPLLQAVRDEMSMQIEQRQAVVNMEGVPAHLEIFGDRLHLGNVFRNLLDNALKYGGERPQIKITAQEQGKGVLISLQDNGIGIPSGQCGLIFEKFQRVGQGNLHDQKGFGLGLAYVKSMVEMHKGQVRVSSELNNGSCFEVFLPKKSDAA